MNENMSLSVGDRIDVCRALAAIETEGRVYARRLIDWKMLGREAWALEAAERLGWHSQLSSSWGGLAFWSQKKGVEVEMPSGRGSWETPLDYQVDVEDWSPTVMPPEHYARVQHYTRERHEVVVRATRIGKRLFVANIGRLDLLPEGYHAAADVHDLARIREEWSGTGEDGVREIVRIAEDVERVDRLALVFLAKVWAGTWGLPS